MITPEQEQRMSDSLAASKKKQDKTHPHLINIKDGRLMPNTPKLRLLPDYRVYDGPIDGTRAQRMGWIKQAISRAPVKIVNTAPVEAAVFDIGKASKDDLITFAFERWGKTLDASKTLALLRTEVAALAQAEPEEESLV